VPDLAGAGDDHHGVHRAGVGTGLDDHITRLPAGRLTDVERPLGAHPIGQPGDPVDVQGDAVEGLLALEAPDLCQRMRQPELVFESLDPLGLQLEVEVDRGRCRLDLEADQRLGAAEDDEQGLAQVELRVDEPLDHAPYGPLEGRQLHDPPSTLRPGPGHQRQVARSSAARVAGKGGAAPPIAEPRSPVD
jgi:hypothetical protein